MAGLDVALLPLDAALRFTNATTETEITDDERRITAALGLRLTEQREQLTLNNLYYDGLQQMEDLGISIPPELKGLRSTLGWAQIGIDAVVERLAVEGFQLSSDLGLSNDLWSIWQSNNMIEESPLAFTDSMVFGRAYGIAGVDDDDTDVGVVLSVESPLQMIATRDLQRRRVTAAYQTWTERDLTSEHYARQRVALYMPDATIQLVSGDNGWIVLERDDHQLGRVPVVQFTNRQRIQKRLGHSEITMAWKNTIDRACRTMLGMEVSREFWGAPKMIILGALEEAFQNADGSAKSAWETYIGRVLALEADGSGNLPSVQTLQGGDPTPFTRLYDVDVRIMAGLMSLPPYYLGIFADGNPASADAIRMSDFRLKTKADRKTEAIGAQLEELMRLALLIRDDAPLPDDADELETIWAPTGIPTPAADTDALAKQVAAGIVPPDSPVVLRRLGYSPVEIAQLSEDRKRHQSDEALAAIMSAVQQPEQTGQPSVEQMPPADDGAGDGES